jgi:hypothetical protein
MCLLGKGFELKYLEDSNNLGCRLLLHLDLDQLASVLLLLTDNSSQLHIFQKQLPTMWYYRMSQEYNLLRMQNQ